MQMLTEVKILGIFSLKLELHTLHIDYSQILTLVFELLWFYLAVTPSIGLYDKLRIIVNTALYPRLCTEDFANFITLKLI